MMQRPDACEHCLLDLYADELEDEVTRLEEKVQELTNEVDQAEDRLSGLRSAIKVAATTLRDAAID